VRAGAGLARTGATIGHGSGDFVIAFSTARQIHHDLCGPGIVETALISDEARMMEHLFPAVVEAVEEAVLNSLCAAETVVGRDGHVRYALPMAEIAQWLTR
jgi:D-aminopeptidase